jgi:prepilin-type N-terminal cleavage/methylation domain-containing protein
MSKRVAQRARKVGFTLVEVMIVTAIIALLAAIIYPAYFNARERSITSTCLNNLRMMTSAKDQYALDNENQMPTLPDLVPTYIHHLPECPAGGTYLMGLEGEDATCNVPGHAL